MSLTVHVDLAGLCFTFTSCIDYELNWRGDGRMDGVTVFLAIVDWGDLVCRKYDMCYCKSYIK